VIPVVTAATESYWPGVKALAASFENAGPGFELHCICYGDLADRCRELGIVPLEPVDWVEKYPEGDRWFRQVPASYARLNLPRQFDVDRLIWIDADCIIQKPLTPLAELDFPQPVAAYYRGDENYTLGFQVPNAPAYLRNVRCTFNGLLVFNVPEWNRRGITEACALAMETGLVFRFIDQSVLSYVLQGDFYRLGAEWQCFANRKDAPLKSARILHWVGGLPWRDELPNAEIWREYAASNKRVDGSRAS